MFPAVEEGTGPGQKDKRRCAEVGDPAGKEDPECDAAGRDAGKDTHVVDGHENHHRAANQIDGRDTGFRYGSGGLGNGKGEGPFIMRGHFISGVRRRLSRCMR